MEEKEKQKEPDLQEEQTGEEQISVKDRDAALNFLKQLLHTNARAKVRVALYPEHHPLVQELLNDLHHLFAEALKDRTELILEFKPGRIIVDKRIVIGNNENIARFSDDMYHRRVARLHFDNSLDFSSLFKFLKFITTEVDALHKQAELQGHFFPQFRGVRVDEVDYEKLMKIRGESLDSDETPEEEESVLEILFGKVGFRSFKGTKVSKYIKLPEEVILSLRDIFEAKADISQPDPNLPEGVQVSWAFRNIVNEIYNQPEKDTELIRKELGKSLLTMPPEILSGLLLEELQDKGESGNLFKLFSYLTNTQVTEIISTLKEQIDIIEFPEMAKQIERITEAIYERGVVQKPKRKKSVPENIIDKEYLKRISKNFEPENISEYYTRIVYEIFESSENIPAIMQGTDVIIKDLSELLQKGAWDKATQASGNIIYNLQGKQVLSKEVYNKIIEKFKAVLVPVIALIQVKALEEDDIPTIDKSDKLLKIFDLTPEQIFLKSLATVEDRTLRKKILTYVLESENFPLSTLMDMLHHEEWYVVRNAVTLIREKPERRFFPLLEKTLSHSREPVVKETLLALSRYKEPRALTLLFQVYQDKSRSEEIRTLAVDCIGSFQDTRTRQLFLDLLLDSHNPNHDKQVRIAAIRQLGGYKDSKTAADLLEFIKKFHLFNRKTWFELKKIALHTLEMMDIPEAQDAHLEGEKYLFGKNKIGS